MPIVANTRNQIFQPLYDTIILGAAAVNGTFFSVPFGQPIAAGVNKNFSHTNLVQAGRLERDTNFTVTAISLFVRETVVRATVADIRNLNTGSFDLLLGTVSFLKVPLSCIPNGGAELEFFSNIAPAATEFQINKGVPAFGNKMVLDVPLKILEQETIQVNIGDFLAAVVAPVETTCVLWGVMERPVR